MSDVCLVKVERAGRAQKGRELRRRHGRHSCGCQRLVPLPLEGHLGRRLAGIAHRPPRSNSEAVSGTFITWRLQTDGTHGR